MNKIIQINTARKLYQKSEKKLSKIAINEIIKQINFRIRGYASNGFCKARFDLQGIRLSICILTDNDNYPTKKHVSEALEYFKDAGYLVKEEDTLLTRWYEVIWEVEDEH